jgi:Family of unknown function (DUF5683)
LFGPLFAAMRIISSGKGGLMYSGRIQYYVAFYFLALPALFAAPKEATPPKKKLIFVNFYNATGNKNIAYLESSIVDSIHELIKNKYAYDRVTPEEWKKFITYSDFTPADYYDPEKLQKIGTHFHADGVIFGKLSNHPNGILITGRILSVIEKEVIAEKELVAPLTAEMFESVNTISEALAVKIKDLFIPSDWGAVRRSAMLPGWGQFYKQRKKWGYIWGGAVGTAFLFSSYFTYAYLKKNNAYRNAEPGDDATSLYNKADSSYTAMQIGWYVTLGLYILNLADAYFFHGDYDLGTPGKTAMLPENISIAVNRIISPFGQAETAVNILWRQPL